MTIPEVGMYNDIAIFPDDENVNLYYCIRTTPHLRMEGETPVFYATFWTKNTVNTAAENVELDGGLVNFDINLGISQAEKDAILLMIEGGIRNNRIATLNAQVKEAKLHENDTAQHFVNHFVLEKGAIELRPVEYKQGTVNLQDNEGGPLLESVSSGSSSLFGDNSASIALTLTPRGAEVWYRTLLEGKKAASIRYDLVCLVRQPSLKIHIHAASFKDEAWEGKAAVKKVTHKLGFFKYNKSETVDPGDLTRKLIDNGLIVIDIDRQQKNIPDDYISGIQESMFEVVKKKVEAMILDRYSGVPEEESKALMEKYLLEDLDAMTDLYFNQRDAIEFPVHPQCTLSDFLKGIPDKTRKEVVHLVDLTDPVLLPHRSVKFRVTAPDYVSYVHIEATCGQEKKSFNFTDKESEQTWVMDMRANSAQPVEYSTKVRFVDTPDDSFCDLGTKTSTGDVLVDVGRIGLIDLVFKPHPDLARLKGKSEVRSIQLSVTYPDGRGGETTVEDFLSPQSAEGLSFRRLVQAVIDKPVRYKACYSFDGLDSLCTEEKTVYLTGPGESLPVYPPCPFSSSLDLTCSLPTLDADFDVDKVTVEFRYEDPERGFEYGDKCVFSKDNDWDDVSVRLYQMNPERDAFKYRFVVKGSQIYQSPWLEGKGDAETLIVPLQAILVDYSLLHMGTDFHSGSLTVRCGDEKDTERFTLTAKCTGEKPFVFFRTVDDNREYSYTLDLFDMDGVHLEPLSGSWKGPVFMLPKPR